jgi:dolichol-phosphate mannosyltransferase
MTRPADSLRTLAVVPTYNERENIVRLCRQLLAQGRSIDVLVVDDASPDGTAELVAELGRHEPRVHLLRRPAKLGLGTAHVAGYRWALARDYERVITMDADFSHPPERIPAMLEASLESDLVIGSRYCPGGGHQDWPWHRQLLSSAANFVARFCLRLEPADCTGAFRCFRRSVLEGAALHNILSRGYSFQEEMLWHCSGRGLRIAEVPILFVDRTGGASKMSLREMLGGVATVLRLLFTPHRRRAPRGLRANVEGDNMTPPRRART